MTWKEILQAEQEKDYYKQLLHFINVEYRTHECYPKWENVLKSLTLTPPDKIKCVILGQDPYHEPGQAMGLSFSVPNGVAIPPSLQNIYKEINSEFGYDIPDNGDLTQWAEQGVLLLNSILTVRAHQAASHKGKGWETFTDSILKTINELDQPVVYMLWGGYARSKTAFLNNPKHLVLEAPHPSPLSVYRGFYGCNHFKRCNEFLKNNGIDEIDWRIK